MKKIINSLAAPDAVGPYSQAVEAAGVVYVSGQLPIDPADGSIPEDIAAQTERCLLNVGAILHEAGCTYEDVVKSTVLLDDMGNFAAMNEVYGEFYRERQPARVCYEVARLPRDVKVEIETIAVKVK